MEETYKLIDCVCIPQVDIDKIERARLQLYALFPDADINLLARLNTISQPMWEITHRRYPRILEG